MKTLVILFLSAVLVGCGGGDAPAPTTAPAVEEPAPTPEPEVAEEAPAPEVPMPNGDATAGEAVYKANCVACHQADGTGMGGALGADFVNDATRLAKSDAQLYDSVTNGVEGTTMIAWKAILDDQQRADSVAYLRATFGK